MSGKLIRAYGGFRCATCFYYGRDGPCCGRRDRRIAWNPALYMCTDYAAGDDEAIDSGSLQTSLDWRWA